MPNLYIITGPAGVGKSTISQKIAERKNKSVLLEGDDIYHQVIGGYAPAWKENNHLDIFWKICLDTIQTYLLNDYDVIFNYIVTPANLNMIKEKFKNYNIKFTVLVVNENILLARDKQRPLNCQMHERCLHLLSKFKNMDFDKNFFLDTSNFSVEETVNIIEKNDNFILK